MLEKEMEVEVFQPMQGTVEYNEKNYYYSNGFSSKIQ